MRGGGKMVIIHPHPDPLPSRERENKPSLPKKFSFTKEERVLKRVQFLNVTADGKKLLTRSFIVFLKPNNLAFSRIGITASRKVGGAVARNRVKRIVREFFRLNKSRIEKGIDIVVIAKREAAGKGFAEVSRELERVLAPAFKFQSGDAEEKRG